MTDLVQAARTFLGVPYIHQGRTALGMDCAGLVVASYRLLGIELQDLKAYGREPWRDGLRQCVEQNFTRQDRAPRPGDVLLLRVRREPQHLAIATDLGIIHAYASVGRVVETNMGRWSGHLVGVYSR